MTEPDTYFAPATRLDQGDVYLQTIKILGLRSAIQVLNILPNLVTILNVERQIVFTNKAFTKYLETKNFDDGLGLRSGELIDCIHANDHINGCGTGKDCKYCGAVLTLLKSQETGVKQESNAKITIKKDGKQIPLDFHIIASPITVDNEVFYIIVLTEYSK
ncbi:MAG: hypothetical protein HZR80_10995 [Candidatus Heimdallarchaeota archaeon]